MHWMRGMKPRWAVRCLVTLAGLACASVAGADTPPLLIDGMVFVASNGEVSELVLRAETARFDLDNDKAYLSSVHVLLNDERQPPGESNPAVVIDCEEGVLDLDSNDFTALGNVRGHTEGGRDFFTELVNYDHAAGLLFTDAPVQIWESGGTYRGGGFRYFVREKRFRLLGCASVVQEQ